MFGRLYYHLEHKYGYKQKNGAAVHFFAHSLGVGEDRELHCVNFPYMASVLAELQQAHRTNRNNFIAAGVSAVGAILSAVFAAVAIFAKA